MDGDLVGLEIYGGVGFPQVKIAEVILYHVGLETKAQHEAPETMPGVNLHDMPEHRMLADGHHGLGPEFRFLLDARAEAAAQDKNRNFCNIHAFMLSKAVVF